MRKKKKKDLGEKERTVSVTCTLVIAWRPSEKRKLVIGFSVRELSRSARGKLSEKQGELKGQSLRNVT